MFQKFICENGERKQLSAAKFHIHVDTNSMQSKAVSARQLHIFVFEQHHSSTDFSLIPITDPYERRIFHYDDVDSITKNEEIARIQSLQ